MPIDESLLEEMIKEEGIEKVLEFVKDKKENLDAAKKVYFDICRKKHIESRVLIETDIPFIEKNMPEYKDKFIKDIASRAKASIKNPKPDYVNEQTLEKYIINDDINPKLKEEFKKVYVDACKKHNLKEQYFDDLPKIKTYDSELASEFEKFILSETELKRANPKDVQSVATDIATNGEYERALKLIDAPILRVAFAGFKKDKGDFKGALEQCDKAIEKQQLPIYYYKRAKIKKVLEISDEVSDLEFAVKSEPKNTTYLDALVDYFEEHKDYKQMKKYCDLILAQSKNAKAQSKRGLANAYLVSAFLKDKFQSDVIKQVDEYFGCSPRNCDYNAIKNIFNDLKEARDKKPENVGYHLDFAEAVYTLIPNDTKLIMRVYDKILEKFTNSHSKNATSRNIDSKKIYAKRGKFYKKLGEDSDNNEYLKKALTEFNEAISLNKNSDDVFCEIALIHKKLKNIGDAREAIDNAIKINPHKSYYYYLRGSTDYMLSVLDIPDFNKAISLNPNVASYYEKRAEILKQQRKYKEAVMDYDSVIRLKGPKGVSAKDYTNRAYARHNNNDWKGAAEDYEKGLELGADNIYYKLLSEAKENVGDFKGAISALNKYMTSTNFNHNWREYKKRSELKSKMGNSFGAKKDAILSWISDIAP